MQRRRPNVLVTGTPGVGKSTFCKRLAQKTVLEWLEISKYATENECTTGEPDPVYQSQILNENKLLDLLEEKLKFGGFIIDHHSSEIFPVRWIDFVIVLVCGNTVLYDRLTARGYTGKKLEDNIDCEIFQTILEDVRESFHTGIIHVYRNITHEELRRHVNALVVLIEEWIHTAADTSTDTSASTTSSDASSPAPHAIGIIPGLKFTSVVDHTLKLQDTPESDVTEYASDTDNAGDDTMVAEDSPESETVVEDFTEPDEGTEDSTGPEVVIEDSSDSDEELEDLSELEEEVEDVPEPNKMNSVLPEVEKVEAELLEPDESARFTPEPEMARPYTPEDEMVAPLTPEPEMQE